MFQWQLHRCQGKVTLGQLQNMQLIQEGDVSRTFTACLRQPLQENYKLTNVGWTGMALVIPCDLLNLNSILLSLFCITALATFTWISSHLMSFSTSSWFKRMNSSCWTTSGKCFWLKTSAACIRSTQLCVSAKSRMPKQFDGSSWLSKNSQQACFTPMGNDTSEWAHALLQSNHCFGKYFRKPSSSLYWNVNSKPCLEICTHKGAYRQTFLQGAKKK